jgi:hypothetical protein
MEWIELALQNPQQNWLLWALFAYGMVRIVWGSLGVMLSMSKNSTQENSLQSETLKISGQLMSEMAAWRNLFQKQGEDNARFQRELVDLYKNSLVRIDATTQSTDKKVDGLGTSGANLHKKLNSVETYLKRLHKTLEEKKVIP